MCACKLFPWFWKSSRVQLRLSTHELDLQLRHFDGHKDPKVLSGFLGGQSSMSLGSHPSLAKMKALALEPLRRVLHVVPPNVLLVDRTKNDNEDYYQSMNTRFKYTQIHQQYNI